MQFAWSALTQMRPLIAAATALIPARVYSYIRGHIPQETLAIAWQRSLDVLRRLSSLSSSATRCLAALELLDEEVVNSDDIIAMSNANISGTSTNYANSNENVEMTGNLANMHCQLRKC